MDKSENARGETPMRVWGERGCEGCLIGLGWLPNVGVPSRKVPTILTFLSKVCLGQ